MTAQLQPVIGDGGVRALFARSVYLTQPAFPWLKAALEPLRTESLFMDLRLNLERREPADTIEANNALLVTFSELLATLIGEQLTEHLLAPVWADTLSDEPTQESSDD